MTSDWDLLRRFARENSQDAFAEIVRRHLNLVYSAARRQVRSPQLAEEVAQSVFADLARNAGKISSAGVSPANSLTPWLYTVTRRTAIDAIRKESRRQLREQIAVEMNNMNATANDWTQIEPLLDDAMAALDETDRSAILLRYFENKNLREVGEALGASEDAAQKRVSRAVERLREFFSKRNVTIGASGLAVLISANAVQSAPIGLAAAISAAAVLAGTAVHTPTVVAATKAIAMTTLQKTLVTATVAVLAGTGIFEAHQASQLREQSQKLQQQQAPLADQIRQLQQQRDDATNQLASLEAENELLKSNPNQTELLKLRGEVGVLRNQLQSLKSQSNQQVSRDAAGTQARPAGNFISKISSVGFESPENAFRSYMSAAASGDYDKLLAAMSPTCKAQAMTPEAKKQFEERTVTGAEERNNFRGLQFLAKKSLGADKVDLEIVVYEFGKGPSISVQHMVKVENEWKYDSSVASDPLFWNQGTNVEAVLPVSD